MKSPVRLLIADDHQVVIDGIRLMLKQAPDLHCVAEAGNGKQVLSQLKQHEIDLVLLDLNMPHLSGMDACEQIKKNYPECKVIMLTMVEDSRTIRKMVQKGVDGYLLKNAGHEEVISAIRQVASGGTFFSEKVKNLLMESLQPGAKATSSGHIPKLSRREKQVLRLILDEHTTAEIAEKLFISTGTVETHRRNMLLKLGAKNTAGLVRKAFENNLLDH